MDTGTIRALERIDAQLRELEMRLRVLEKEVYGPNVNGRLNNVERQVAHIVKDIDALKYALVEVRAVVAAHKNIIILKTTDK
jgi:uncharacterized coiled-coil protein SlyX